MPFRCRERELEKRTNVPFGSLLSNVSAYYVCATQWYDDDKYPTIQQKRFGNGLLLKKGQEWITLTSSLNIYKYN